jgi:SEC-C motif-containing protein
VCCEPYHKGALPENALLLMRSRYAAYARHRPDYIIATTHPTNPAYTTDTARWKQDILAFSKATRFLGLTIHAFLDGSKEAFVVFTAQLEQKGLDASFTEKSRFLKESESWFYVDGEKFN